MAGVHSMVGDDSVLANGMLDDGSRGSACYPMRSVCRRVPSGDAGVRWMAGAIAARYLPNAGTSGDTIIPNPMSSRYDSQTLSPPKRLA